MELEQATESHVKYQAVNGQWPDDLPKLDGDEAIAAAKRLYRFAMKKPWRGRWKLTSGNRYTWPKGSTFYVNPAGQHFGGWRDLVHFISHYCHRQLWPSHKPHAATHHHIEREMVEYVIKSGWLDGRLKRKPKAKPDPKAVKRDRVEAAIQRWESKRRRAENALRKLKRQKARWEKDGCLIFTGT